MQQGRPVGETPHAILQEVAEGHHGGSHLEFIVTVLD